MINVLRAIPRFGIRAFRSTRRLTAIAVDEWQNGFCSFSEAAKIQKSGRPSFNGKWVQKLNPEWLPPGRRPNP
jgi:hypothetical protein